MFRNFNNLRSSSNRIFTLVRSSQFSQKKLHSTASFGVNDTKEKSAIYCAVCLQRHAVLIPPQNEMEQSFSNLMNTMEIELSKYSDHEMRHLKDLERVEKKKKGEDNLDEEEENIITAMDMEDTWENELASFKPADLEIDVGKDSPYRKLSEKLFYVVQQKLGDKTHWVFPQTPLHGSESLRDAAERLVKEKLPNSTVTISGNAPVGVYKYSFSENGRKVPVKVFFYRGDVHTPKKVEDNVSDKDSMWLSSNELAECLQTRYHRSVNKYLLDL